MNKDLAQKLKDAGFPQNPKGHSERPEMGFDEDGESRNFEPYEVYNPTLSELIEALKDSVFLDLIKSRNNRWIVTDHYKKVDAPTIEEAVAGLWLELNKKEWYDLTI